jgi:hypothetical protein
MTVHLMTLQSAHRTPHRSSLRQRAPRPLNLFDPLAEERTAAAMDDAVQAERLIADLLALVDAGLVTPIDGIDGVRYAPADPFDPAA